VTGALAFSELGNGCDSLSKLQRRIVFQFDFLLLPSLVVIASCHRLYPTDRPAEWLVLMLSNLFQAQSVGLFQTFFHQASAVLW